VTLDRALSEALASKAGLTVHARVTKKVQLLVDCDPTSASGNEQKANEYNIPVIAEHEFWQSLGIDVQQVDWRQRAGPDYSRGVTRLGRGDMDGTREMRPTTGWPEASASLVVGNALDCDRDLGNVILEG
jgi:hypothetical protein